jgi:hypothetical protein
MNQVSEIPFIPIIISVIGIIFIIYKVIFSQPKSLMKKMPANAVKYSELPKEGFFTKLTVP